jgi:hypothetical protein
MCKVKVLHLFIAATAVAVSLALPSTSTKTRKAKSSKGAPRVTNFVELTSLASGAQEVPPIETSTVARIELVFDQFLSVRWMQYH